MECIISCYEQCIFVLGKNTIDIKVSFGNLFYCFRSIYREQLLRASVGSSEEDALGIIRPEGISCYAVIPVLSQVGLCFAVPVHDVDIIFISFVAISCHAEPSEVISIRAEHWVGVISHHSFGKVLSFSCGKVISEDIRIGALGIFLAGMLFRYEKQMLGIR